MRTWKLHSSHISYLIVKHLHYTLHKIRAKFKNFNTDNCNKEIHHLFFLIFFLGGEKWVVWIWCIKTDYPRISPPARHHPSRPTTPTTTTTATAAWAPRIVMAILGTVTAAITSNTRPEKRRPRNPAAGNRHSRYGDMIWYSKVIKIVVHKTLRNLNSRRVFHSPSIPFPLARSVSSLARYITPTM